MKILVTNDDGIQSKGLKTLVDYLSKSNEVYVVAPDSQRSGFSHSMTFRRPMYMQEVFVKGAKQAFSLTGSPGDCVRFALKCLNLDIDMVVAGPNIGPNLTVDVYYSGTVGAASEGAILGKPSIALSYACKHIDENLLDFDATCDFLEQNINKFYSSHKSGTVFNVNVPCAKKEEIKGVKVVPYGTKMFEDVYEEHLDLVNNKKGFSLEGDFIAFDMPEETDAYYIGQNYITVTPLKLDICDHELLKILKEKF